MLKRFFIAVMFLIASLTLGACASGPGGPVSGQKAPAGAVSAEGKTVKKQDEKMVEARREYFAGLVAMNHADWNVAAGHLEKAVELDPKSYFAHIFLGKAYVGMKQLLKAVPEFEAAIALQKTWPRAYYELTSVYLQEYEPGAAAKVGEEALKNGVPEAAVSTDLGWSYFLAGDLDKAEARLRIAKRLTGDKDTAPIHDLGLTLFEMGRYDEALENFKEVLKMNPKSIIMPYDIALTYNKLGRKDKVMEALREGLKKDPALAQKAPVYNKMYFPRINPGDLAPYFARLGQEKQEKKAK